jgi:pilus assembly protein CpaE
MDERLDILCLSLEQPAAADVIGTLRKLPGFKITVSEADYQAGLRALREREPDLAIVILGAEPVLGLAVIEEVQRNAPATQILALCAEDSPETIIKAMRAGADEFLPLDATPNALLKVCIKVSEVRRCNRPNAGPHGEVWVVHSPKGGVGVTTLVANLGYALRAASRDVTLVDLDLSSGDLSLFLNITPTYTLRDIIENFKRLDSVFLQGTLSPHPSGLSLLAAPLLTPGEEAPHIPGEQVQAILELLRNMHEVTVVDTPHLSEEATRRAVVTASRILLVTELTVPSLRRCLRSLDWMRNEGIEPEAKVELIINKHLNKPVEVPAADAAKTLGLSIRATLVRDDLAAINAVNRGLSLSEVGANTMLQQAIAGLASRDGASETGPKRRSGLLRLFSSEGKKA